MDRNIAVVIPMAVISLAVGSVQAWNMVVGSPQRAPPVAGIQVPSDERDRNELELAVLQWRLQVSEGKRQESGWQLRKASAQRSQLLAWGKDLQDTVGQLQRELGRLQDTAGQFQRLNREASAQRLQLLDWGRDLQDTVGQLRRQRVMAEAMQRLQIHREKVPAVSEADAGLAAAWEQSGRQSLEQGRTREGNEAFYRVLAVTPRDPVLHYNLAVLSDYLLKEPARALYHYQFFLEIAPEDPDAPRTRQRLQRLQGTGP